MARKARPAMPTPLTCGKTRPHRRARPPQRPCPPQAPPATTGCSASQPGEASLPAQAGVPPPPQCLAPLLPADCAANRSRTETAPGPGPRRCCCPVAETLLPPLRPGSARATPGGGPPGSEPARRCHAALWLWPAQRTHSGARPPARWATGHHRRATQAPCRATATSCPTQQAGPLSSATLALPRRRRRGPWPLGGCPSLTARQSQRTVPVDPLRAGSRQRRQAGRRRRPTQPGSAAPVTCRPPLLPAGVRHAGPERKSRTAAWAQWRSLPGRARPARCWTPSRPLRAGLARTRASMRLVPAPPEATALPLQPARTAAPWTPRPLRRPDPSPPPVRPPGPTAGSTLPLQESASALAGEPVVSGAGPGHCRHCLVRLGGLALALPPEPLLLPLPEPPPLALQPGTGSPLQPRPTPPPRTEAGPAG